MCFSYLLVYGQVIPGRGYIPGPNRQRGTEDLKGGGNYPGGHEEGFPGRDGGGKYPGKNKGTAYPNRRNNYPDGYGGRGYPGGNGGGGYTDGDGYWWGGGWNVQLGGDIFPSGGYPGGDGIEGFPGVDGIENSPCVDADCTFGCEETSAGYFCGCPLGYQLVDKG